MDVEVERKEVAVDDDGRVRTGNSQDPLCFQFAFAQSSSSPKILLLSYGYPACLSSARKAPEQFMLHAEYLAAVSSETLFRCSS